MTAAKNLDVMCHLTVKRGAEAHDNTWRCADLRQSNVQRHREATGFFYSRSDVCNFVLFSLFAVVSICFLPAIYEIDESDIGPTPALFYFWAVNPTRCFSQCLYTSLLYFI